MSKKLYVLLLTALLVTTCRPTEPPLRSWRDEIVYFILVDRFRNGDPSNDTGGIPGSHIPYTGDNPEALKTYQGGDLLGIMQELDNLKSLGVTALWLSPIWDNSNRDYVGWWPYHGYQPVNFYQVEEHFGDKALLKKLVRNIHDKGFKLLCDLALNQTAADHPWVTDQTHRDWFHHDSTGRPFDITDWNDQRQLEMGELHGLPDLAQENPQVTDTLLAIAYHWAKLMECDGFRLDAVKHIPRSFWKRFNAEIRQAFGSDFLLLGEVFWGEAERLAPYATIGFNALFDIPGYYAIHRVFGQGASAKLLSQALRQKHRYYGNLLVARLIDNHDLPRFNTGLRDHPWERERLALGYILTLPGLPVLYYGTEIGMPGAPVLNSQTGEPQDYLNRLPYPTHFSSEQQRRWQDTRQLIELRKVHPALRRGRFLELYRDWGVYAYLRLTSREHLAVFINTAVTPETIRVALGDSLSISGLNSPVYGSGLVKLHDSALVAQLPPLSLTVVPFQGRCRRQSPWVTFTDRFTGDYRLVELSYPASISDTLAVAGDFNNWQPQPYKQRHQDGRVVTTLPLRLGRYRYKFVVNGKWVADPAATERERDPYGGWNSILNVQ